MGITLKPEYLKRYMDIARLFMKYGGENVVLPLDIEGANLSSEALQHADGKSNDSAAENGAKKDSETTSAVEPDSLAKDLEAL